MNKKYWPVPNSFFKNVPKKGTPGSFWEDRYDRYHFGVDIYAPEGSNVVSIDDGKVLDIGIFTSPDKISYWKRTYYILIKNKDGFICKYAELKEIIVKIDESVKAGQLIGSIGTVLDVENITKKSPQYIQKLKSNKFSSMLHFEVYKSKPNIHEAYLGGNWFGNKKPGNLLNPEDYL